MNIQFNNWQLIDLSALSVVLNNGLSGTVDTLGAELSAFDPSSGTYTNTRIFGAGFEMLGNHFTDANPIVSITYLGLIDANRSAQFYSNISYNTNFDTYTGYYTNFVYHANTPVPGFASDFQFSGRFNVDPIGNLLGGTATNYTVTVGSNIVSLAGNFTIDAAGDITGGTVTGFRFFDGSNNLEATGTSISYSIFDGLTDGPIDLTGLYNLINTPSYLTGNDTITGDANANNINSGLGSDVINAGAGADTLDGGVSDVYNPGTIDVLNGGDGNDTFLSRGFYGAGVYDGGNDIDTLDFSEADTYTAGRRTAEGAGVKVDLSLSKAFVYYTKTGNIYLAANTAWADANGQIAVSNIENAIGTAQSDLLIGDANANQLEGGAGDDTLSGGLGIDTLIGGLGDDTYIYDGVDTITEDAGEGNDTVQASVTASLIGLGIANIENLTLTGTAAINGTGDTNNNALTGNTASNTLNGDAGDDTLDGGVSDVYNPGVTDTLNGDAGNDTFLSRGFYGAGVYDGGNDIDTLDFSQSDAYTAGRRTAERAGVKVDLEAGNASTYYSKTGNIYLAANTAWADANGQIVLSGIENVRGSAQSDLLIGDGNDNVIDSGLGSDVINAGAGADTLDGGVSDVYNPGTIDVLNGGDGNDTFLSRGFYGAGVYDGGNDIDTLDFSEADTYTAGRRTAEGAGVKVDLSLSKAFVYYTKTGNIYLAANTAWADANGQIAVSNIENAIGTAQSDLLIGDANANQLEGGAGDDTLAGGAGADILIGGGGADIFDFNVVTESAVGVSHDVIADFNVAQFDKIDLSGIDANANLVNDQAFSFIGTNIAFSNVAGQLMFDSATNSVLGDVNGDAVADFQIALTGVTSLVAGDFIL